MKKILFFVFCAFSCDNHEKLTAYLKPFEEARFNISSDDFIHKISFMFFIDTSGSMAGFNNSLAGNIALVVEPILKNYPFYGYNFAITTMTPAENFTGKNPLFFTNNLKLQCGGADFSSLSRPSEIGSYIRYFPSDPQHKKISRQELICALSENIRQAEGFNGAEESYFQSLSYIIQNADEDFIFNFFGGDKLLVLFWISDAYEFDYDKIRAKGLLNFDEAVANQHLNLIQSMMGEENIRSYAVIADNRKGDTCGQEMVGTSPGKYPFHLYNFIEKTNGLRISICDNYWGKQLTDVFKSLKSSLFNNVLYLDKIPHLETIEVFFNGQKIPKDIKKGWSFHPEDVSISIGSDFDFSQTASNQEEFDNSQITVKYHPVNIELLEKE